MQIGFVFSGSETEHTVYKAQPTHFLLSPGENMALCKYLLSFDNTDTFLNLQILILLLHILMLSSSCVSWTVGTIGAVAGGCKF